MIKEVFTINRYIVRERKILEADNFEYRFPVILEQFTLASGEVIEVPSVFNKFTYNKYKRKPISVSKNINTTICQFLNFTREKAMLGDDSEFIKLKKKKISGLTFYHLKEFLIYCIDICDNSYSTIKQKERRLLNFYRDLNNCNLINVKWKYNMIYDPKENKRKKIIQSPFDLVEYHIDYPPMKKNYIKIVDLKDNDIDLLLRICEEKVPDILFAVALGIYGGLRKGEIVNLRTSDLRLFEDKNIMSVDIKDRPKLFEGRALSDSGAKKPRIQVVLNDNGKLYTYYERHITYRNNMLSKKNTRTEALFIDTNGQALTGSNYLHRFDRLKQLFLKEKELDNYTDYLRLSENKWGSHICRGIFTNLCVRRGYARSIEELRNLRGDKSITSSEPYWNTYEIENQIQYTLDVITSCYKYKTDLN